MKFNKSNFMICGLVALLAGALLADKNVYIATGVVIVASLMFPILEVK